LAFARHQFELSKPQEDGAALLVHLQLVEEKTGRPHPLIANAPPLPQGLETLWLAFLDLHSCRGSTGWGPQRITFLDMDGWQRVTGGNLNPWEVGLIRQADSIWLADYAPKPKESGQ
jgi:hypothetical protein